MASKSNPGGGTGSIGNPAKKPSKPASSNPGGGTGSVGAPVSAVGTQKATNGLGTGAAGIAGSMFNGGVGTGATDVAAQIAAQAPHPAAPATPTAAAPAAPAALDPDEADANTLIQTFLGNAGLGALGALAWNKALNGESSEQIMLELQDTPEFQNRFPGIVAQKAAGQTPIKPGDYLNYETAALTAMQGYGIDTSTAGSRAEIGNLIANNVSPTELSNRLQTYYMATQQIPGEARDYLANTLGITSGNLIDYYLNPTVALPALQMKVQQAQIGGAAAQSGYGFLDAANALRLANEGVSAQQAQQGFGKIAGQQQFTQDLGDGTGSVSNADLMSGVFENNAGAQARAQQVAAGRVAKFQSGGSFAAGQGGVSGLAAQSRGF